MFLDEPTTGKQIQAFVVKWHGVTGLDSTNASKVVDILSDMASAGVAVVMTIHQPRPDLFRILDRSMLLSGNGQVIWFLSVHRSMPILITDCLFWTSW